MQAINKLNQLLIDFYDHFSSWEQSVMKETGCSQSQMHSIKVLGEHNILKMTELAKKVGVTTGTLTVQVNKLVKAGLIERRYHEEDRRTVLVTLTEEGKERYEHYAELHQNLTQNLTRHVNSKQRDVLITCLEKINREF